MAYSWKLCIAQAVTARTLFHLSTEMCEGVVLLWIDSLSNRPRFWAAVHASRRNLCPSLSRPYFASTRSGVGVSRCCSPCLGTTKPKTLLTHDHTSLHNRQTSSIGFEVP